MPVEEQPINQDTMPVEEQLINQITRPDFYNELHDEINNEVSNLLAQVGLESNETETLERQYRDLEVGSKNLRDTMKNVGPMFERMVSEATRKACKRMREEGPDKLRRLGERLLVDVKIAKERHKVEAKKKEKVKQGQNKESSEEQTLESSTKNDGESSKRDKGKAKTDEEEDSGEEESERLKKLEMELLLMEKARAFEEQWDEFRSECNKLAAQSHREVIYTIQTFLRALAILTSLGSILYAYLLHKGVFLVAAVAVAAAAAGAAGTA